MGLSPSVAWLTSLLESRWFLIAVVEFELFFGLWLLSGLFPSSFGREAGGEGLTWLAALGCFSLFACVSLYKALSGAASCGCFGPVRVNPWYTTTLDVALVAALLRWRPNGLSDLKFRQLATRTACVLLAWLSVGLPAAYAMGSYSDTTLSDAGEVIGDGRIVVLEPETWIGVRFPLLNYVDVGEKLQEGKCLVLLYHPNCPLCRETIRNLRRLSEEAGTRRVALIEMPPYEKPSDAGDCRGLTLIDGRLRNTREWFVRTPVVLVLEGGVVRSSSSPEA
jgi:hypothetical protein